MEMQEMSDYIEREKDKFIKLSQALEVLNTSPWWLIHDDMERIPAADVRPMTREKWIWEDNGEVVCSECNDLVAVVGNTEDLETIISGFNFCPNCGADMRKESDELL